MYCSIVRVRVWTALCVFKTFVLPWQRLRKKFKSMWLSQLTNLISNLLKISQNSENDTPHTPQLSPLPSSADAKSKLNIIVITIINIIATAYQICHHRHYHNSILIILI